MVTKQQPWWLYLLDCDGRQIYTGIAIDVQRRLLQHQGHLAGGAKSTRAGKRVRLVYKVEVGGRSEAARLEARVKKLSRTDKLGIVASQPDIEQLKAIVRMSARAV